jgi:hypothetical protein
MADPTTFLELAQARQAAAAAAVGQSAQTLAATQKALDTAKTAYAGGVKELAALNAEAGKLREALAAVQTTADGEALLEELEETTALIRAAETALLDEDRAIAQARFQSEEAQEANAGAAAAAKATGAALQEALQRENRILGWQSLLNKEPLKSLRAAADAGLNTPPKNAKFLAAKAGIEADFPAALLERARERRHQQAALTSSAEHALDAAVAQSPDKLRAAVARAEARLSAYVNSARGRFDGALTLLAQVADPANQPLTAAQKARLNDAAFLQKASDAAAAQNTLDDARAVLAEKQAALEEAILTAQLADIDADPAANGDVQTATGGRDDAQGDVDTAAAAFTPAMKQDLAEWNLAMPVSSWRRLLQFEEAVATLTELKDTDPQALVTAVRDAEKAAVAAELVNNKTQRRDRFLERYVKRATAASAQAASGGAARAFAALRGDL